MRKILLLIGMIVSLAAGAQTVQQITPPQYFLTYISVHDSALSPVIRVSTVATLPTDTAIGAPVGSIASKGSTVYVKGTANWTAVTGAAGNGQWGFITGSISAQTDLWNKFGTKYDTTVRKMDTLYTITDSTYGFKINGNFTTFKARGAIINFNGRTGAIVLSSTDIQNALTYRPLAPSDTASRWVSGLRKSKDSIFVCIGGICNFVFRDSTGSCTGCLVAANNLSDLTSASTARTNLGLGSIATLGTSMGGDANGNYPNPKNVGLQGYSVSVTAPTAGQALIGSGTQWAPALPGGDLSGTFLNTTVSKIQGWPVSNSPAPATNQLLVFTGSGWNPYTLTGDLTTTGAGQFKVTSLNGTSLTSTVPTTGQGLFYNGTQWTPSSLFRGVSYQSGKIGLGGSTDTAVFTGNNPTFRFIDGLADSLIISSSTGFVHKDLTGSYTAIAGSQMQSYSPLAGINFPRLYLNNTNYNTAVDISPYSGFANGAPGISLNVPSTWNSSNAYPAFLFVKGSTNIGSISMNSGDSSIGFSQINSRYRFASLIVKTNDSTNFKPIVADASGNLYKAWAWPGGVPSGAAGGHLSGTYPNPSLAIISLPVIKIYPGSSPGLNTDSVLVKRGDSTAHAIAIAALVNGLAVGGDLIGALPNPTVKGLQGNAVSNAAPSAGQVLQWAAVTGWTPTTPAFNPTGAAGGDLSGTYPNPGVAKLNGIPAPASAPVAGQMLYASGTTALAYGSPGGNLGGTFPNPTIVSVPSTAKFLPATSPGLNTDSVMVKRAGDSLLRGITATQLITGLTAGGDLSGTYPNPTVARLQTIPVSGTAPTTGQGLLYNGTQWAPSSSLFLNGGNIFGGVANLGTNDNYGINLRTNGTTAIHIDSLQATLFAGKIGSSLNSNRFTFKYDGNNGMAFVFPDNSAIQFLDLANYHYIQSIGTPSKGLNISVQSAPIEIATQYNTITAKFATNGNFHIGPDTTDMANKFTVQGTTKITDTLKLPNIAVKTNDTTNYKPAVFDAAGNLYKSWAWAGSGGGHHQHRQHAECHQLQYNIVYRNGYHAKHRNYFAGRIVGYSPCKIGG